MSLKTDYKDAIPVSSLRKYKQVDNGDGTVSFQDVTEYTQMGDKAQASVFNGIGTEVNAIESTANAAVQSATLGGSVVSKSGTVLQLPAYPTSLPANGGNANYANTAGSAPANGGTSAACSGTATYGYYAHYPSHAVGLTDWGLRGNYIANWGPSGGSDGDTWDQY